MGRGFQTFLYAILLVAVARAENGGSDSSSDSKTITIDGITFVWRPASEDIRVQSQTGEFVRVRSAKVVAENPSAVSDLDGIPKSESDRHKWLLDRSAFISVAQLFGNGRTNTDVQVDPRKRIKLFRPRGYGRGAQGDGEIEFKGSGHYIVPQNKNNNNGLLSLRMALWEYVMERTERRILEHFGYENPTVRNFAVVDLGFDMKDWETGKWVPAGLLVREKHARGKDSTILPKQRLILLAFGISDGKNVQMSDLSDGHRIVDFGHHELGSRELERAGVDFSKFHIQASDFGDPSDKSFKDVMDRWAKELRAGKITPAQLEARIAAALKRVDKKVADLKPKLKPQLPELKNHRAVQQLVGSYEIRDIVQSGDLRRLAPMISNCPYKEVVTEVFAP